ncbi:MAG: hypothetical protein ISS87_00750 [Candidatus Pacebacteria bacterium]|nr:hypothetical protein [Candidatus Paceibacterota bacterium]
MGFEKLFKPYKRYLLIFSVLFCPVTFYFFVLLITGGSIPDNFVISMGPEIYLTLILFPAGLIHDIMFPSFGLHVGNFPSPTYTIFLIITVLVYSLIINKIIDFNKKLGKALLIIFLITPWIIAIWIDLGLSLWGRM